MVGRCAIGTTDRDDAPDTSLALVEGVAAGFAGSLDNASELRAELGRRGAAPGSSSPAALIAAAHRVYGEALPARLRGVFTVAVTDGERLHCFRDHLGYASLFYRRDGGGFYAATEAKQVIAGAGLRREPDLEVVERILFGTVDDDMPCAVRGVERLPKMHGIVAGDGGARRHQYWDPAPLIEAAPVPDDELQERFAALMDQAVTRCLSGSDVISLSGGIDSPGIAAFAARRHLERSGRPLQALSAVYPRYPSVDERPYIECAARAFDIPLHTFEQQAHSLADLERWVALADSPFPTASMAQYAEDYELAKGLGARVVLSGEHAEFVCSLNWHMFDHLITHGRIRPLRRQVRNRFERGASRPTVARALLESVAPRAVLAARERRRQGNLPDWVDVPKASEAVARRIVGPRDRWRRLQLSAFIGPGISVEAESVCQAVCGIRSRRPWTDIDLFEFFLGLPAEQKFPDAGSKTLVRRLLRGRVPDEILDRRDKTVFDESTMAEIDYGTLRRLVVDPQHRFEGIDYGLLGERIRHENFTLPDFVWARQLASAHAFLAQW